MQKIIILLSLAGVATSKNPFNISAFDSQLRDIFNGLVQTETKIGSFLTDLSTFVGEVNLKSNKSCLRMELSHLQLLLQLQGSIWNYETYQQLTGCSNVASKISEIKVDLKKFADFVDRLELNMTELYQRNLRVTYDLMLKPKELQVAQQDVMDIILSVNEATVQYLFYILQLQVNIQHEKSIATNLKLFLVNYCECDENVYGVSKNTNQHSSLNSMEAALLACQTRITSAVNVTLIESQKLATSKNVTKKMKILTSNLEIFCQKMNRVDDYSNASIPITSSCPELMNVQNFLTYRHFHYTQVLSMSMINTSILIFYKNLINSIISDGSSQNTSILSAVSNLETELKNYTDELAVQLSYLTEYSSVMRRNAMILRLFCGCKVLEPKTTTSTTRKLTFTSATFMTTNLGQTTKKTPKTTKKKLVTSTTSTTTATTTSKLSTSPRITRPTVPKITTLPPYSNPACSFTKPLTDRNGNYIKTACLIETASNGSYANSTCLDNSMQLMAVDSNMTQTALTIFVQETLSEGTFWINGGNGSDICNFVTVNGTGAAINRAKCNMNQYYSICEYKDSKVPAKVSYPRNLDACGFIFPATDLINDDNPRYACVMAYLRSYIDSSYNCMLNGMEMFRIAPIKVMMPMNEFLVSLFGNNSGIMMWVDAPGRVGSCSLLDGGKVPFAVAADDCDKLHWSICETPYDESY